MPGDKGKRRLTSDARTGQDEMNAGNPPVGRPRLILIAGLQKSGTSLLLRLLVEHTSMAENPFDGIEGHAFWGNVPSHAPREFPAGTIYARHNGDAGHEISASDAEERVRTGSRGAIVILDGSQTRDRQQEPLSLGAPAVAQGDLSRELRRCRRPPRGAQHLFAD